MKNISTLVVASLTVLTSSLLAAPDLSKLPPAAKTEGVTYAKDIRPIFEASCFRCHGEQRPKAGLRLDSLEGVLKGTKDGKVIVPGKSEESQLVIAVSRLDPKTAMPPKPRGGPGGRPAATPSGDGKTPPQKDGAPPASGKGPMAKPLTAEQVGLVRAWVDQGAK